jgi:hypothetical protein
MTIEEVEDRGEGVMFVCPPPPKESLSLETRLCVGFGWVSARRDGETVWQGDNWQKKLKSVERLEPIHTAQVLTYLRLSGLKVGLLINFNVKWLLDCGLKRIVHGFPD